MLLPAVAGFGVPVLVTARSQPTMINVATEVLLLAELGSVVVAVTEEFAVMVPVAVVGTFTTTRMSAVAPAARVGSLQVTVPVPPTAGDVHVHPAGGETDSNVVFVGVASVKTTAEAEAGPLLVTAWV